jgi:predicted 3-demethylubiquinone-9 3-methyltransferase (glyoxalase superfamily)
MQKITPFLWFDGKAEEAANFYVGIFKNSKILGTIPGPDGTVVGVTFQLDGQEFKAFNGGPQFKFNEAISLFVDCENQQEVDELWEKLSEGGQPIQCGWLKDEYGVVWQIIPADLMKMFSDPDRAKAQRAINAMFKMVKIDVQALKQAFEKE